MNKSTESVINEAFPRGGWYQAALGTALGIDMAKTGRMAGVHPRTVYRWREKPHFKQLVNKIRQKLLEDALGYLISKYKDALEIISSLGENCSEPPNVRLGAAKAMAELALKTDDHVSVLAEMAMLKEKVAALEKRHPEG